MILEDQNEVIAFLGSPETHHRASVERMETHASIVFLAGGTAYKLKRAVRYDYLDFSTADRRRQCSEAELRINRQAAPGIYRRVVPITRDARGGLALGGDGTPVDWVIEMTRFDQDALFDRLAARGALDLALMRPLGAQVAAFHAQAAQRPDQGGANGMAWVIDGNAEAFRGAQALLHEASSVGAPLISASRAALDRHRDLLDRRRDEGFVRQCHGDLHLRNIVLFDGTPTLFDAIEFNDALSCVDVQYDLAFLLMDLWGWRLRQHANAVFNGYLAATVDVAALAVLPLFLSCRAAIRAKTTLAAAALASDGRAQQLDTARGYLHAAGQLLRSPRPALVAIGGVSGTGKSTLARAIAPFVGPVPGAALLRTDEIRKRLCGVHELSRLGANGYTEDVSRRVYETLAMQAADVVRAGHSAIADAVFMNPGERATIEKAASAVGVPFAGLWLQAPEPLLVERVNRRRADVSDADAALVHKQLAREPGAIAWNRLDASPDSETIRQRALHLLDSLVHGGITLAA